MQTTLVILKPDCLNKAKAGQVLDRFERAGYAVVGMKMVRLTQELLREHYAHLADKPFYPEIANFMLSRPVVVIALKGENVISGVRELLGPTDSRKAAKGTIRGDFGGPEIMYNVVHASDSEQAATAELARFFRPEELFAAA